MGEDELLFTQNDPRNYSITLTSERYYGHIIEESGHTDGPVKDIQEAIKQPVAIFQSSQRPSRDVYFSQTSSIHPQHYIKVTTEIDEENKTGDVVTAFISPEIKGGINIEGGLKYIGYSNKL